MNMKSLVNKSTQYLALIIVAFFVMIGCSRLPVAKVTLQAVDENRNPLSDANVSLWFEKKLIEGKTDMEGKMSGEGESLGTVTYRVTKEGYYESGSTNHVRYTKIEGKQNSEKYLPWNETVQVIMKKVENPVSMFAKSVELRIPKEAVGVPIGFDLEQSDWIKPYGKGKKADFIFTISGKKADWKTNEEGISRSSLELSFSNAGDGIQEIIHDDNDTSKYILPFKNAPLNNYLPKWEMVKARTYTRIIEEKGFRENQNFVFRVRTEQDNKGNILKAKYGKIYGPVTFSGTETGGFVHFVYYLNPDGTRNLEFDPNKNLFNTAGHERQDTIYDP